METIYDKALENAITKVHDMVTKENAMQALFDALDESHKKTWGDIADKVNWYGIPHAPYGSEEYEIIKAKADYIRTINYNLAIVKRGKYNDR